MALGYCSSPAASIEDTTTILSINDVINKVQGFLCPKHHLNCHNDNIDNLIDEMYDEHPRLRLTCQTPVHFTSRLISQYDIKRTARIRKPASPVNQEAQP